MYTYIYIYIHMHMCVYIYTYIIYVCIHSYHTYIYIYICTCICVCVYIYIYIYVYMHIKLPTFRFAVSTPCFVKLRFPLREQRQGAGGSRRPPGSPRGVQIEIVRGDCTLRASESEQERIFEGRCRKKWRSAGGSRRPRGSPSGPCPPLRRSRRSSSRLFATATK